MAMLINLTDICGLYKSLTPEQEWSFAGITPSQTGKWSHNFHRYPAKFIPQLVEKLFDEYIHQDSVHINDPFMGSGTTIVSAISRGYKASGTDINAIAYLMTKVKVTPIDPKKLEKTVNRLLTEISDSSIQNSMFHQNIQPTIPLKHIQRIDYWFRPEQKEELGKILTLILQEQDIDCRNFFLVAFSNILKNCSIWLQRSTKPTRDQNKIPENPATALRRQLKKMQRGNNQFYEVVPNYVRENLASVLIIKQSDASCQPVEKNTVDLVITSSPYVTSYEYADLHQLSTLWLDFADDLAEYRKGFIGTSSKIYASNGFLGDIANYVVDEMSDKHQKTAKEIEAYFIDMVKVFTESYRILKSGGRCCYVIGNTKIKSVNILNAEVFTESLAHVGFLIERIIVRQIPLKILPQKRDEKTGRFAKSQAADTEAYPYEYIIIGLKPVL